MEAKMSKENKMQLYEKKTKDRNEYHIYLAIKQAFSCLE